MFRRAVYGLPTLVLALFAGLIAGCSAPPQKERDQADSAITAARAADAAEYAPTELQTAIASLVEYDRAVAQGDYRLALNHAIAARDVAYNAAKVASERKTAIRNEAERLIVDFRGQVMVAKSRLSAGPPLPAPAANRTRSTIRAAEKLLQEANSRLERQDYKEVVALLQTLVLTLRKDLAQPGGRRGK
jgi:hypothetical protein